MNEGSVLSYTVDGRDSRLDLKGVGKRSRSQSNLTADNSIKCRRINPLASWTKILGRKSQ